MDRHLNEAELNEGFAGNLPPDVAEHLNVCAICRSSRDEMDYLLRDLSAEASELADKPDEFWLAQRRQIRNRIPQPRGFFAPRLAWAGIAATVALAIALLMSPGPSPKPKAPVMTAENDQELLVDVEQTLNSNLAPPLEPTGALVDAMTQMASTNKQ